LVATLPHGIDQAYADISAGKLKTRSLVVWGALDPQVPLGLGRRFNALLKANGVASRLVVIGVAGHAPFVEFQATFGGILRAGCPTDGAGKETPVNQ